MNKELQEKENDANDEPDDPDDIETQNISMNLPSGAYHRIAMQSRDFNLDICSPASGMDFEQLLDSALHLAIFSSA